MELLILLFTFGLMWLFLIRPQQRRMRAHQAIVAALEPGDEVVTAGGIHGTVLALDADDVRLEIAPGVVIRVLRGAISQRSGPVREPDTDDEELEELEEADQAEEIDDEEEPDEVQVEAVEVEDRGRKVDENGS